jgi:hypothetical protein
VGLRACSTLHIRTPQLTMEPDNRPPNGVFAKVICRRTAPGAIDKHRACCASSSRQPAFLVNATKEWCRFQGHWWPALPVEQLYDAAGQELLVADFSRGKHILDHLTQVRDQGDIVVVDVGYSDMLMLDITAPRPSRRPSRPSLQPSLQHQQSRAQQSRQQLRSQKQERLLQLQTRAGAAVQGRMRSSARLWQQAQSSLQALSKLRQ